MSGSVVKKDIFCKMGKLNIFEITLSNLQGVYYAGQNVQGHCTVELNEEMSMRGNTFCAYWGSGGGLFLCINLKSENSVSIFQSESQCQEQNN